MNTLRSIERKRETRVTVTRSNSPPIDDGNVLGAHAVPDKAPLDLDVVHAGCGNR